MVKKSRDSSLAGTDSWRIDWYIVTSFASILKCFFFSLSVSSVNPLLVESMSTIPGVFYSSTLSHVIDHVGDGGSEPSSWSFPKQDHETYGSLQKNNA